MSIQAMTWAFDQNIQPARKIVLLAIANCANAEGQNAFPGQESLAKQCSMSMRSVGRHIGWLEAQGYLSRVKRYRRDGMRTSDNYALPIGARARRKDNVIEVAFSNRLRATK